MPQKSPVPNKSPQDAQDPCRQWLFSAILDQVLLCEHLMGPELCPRILGDTEDLLSVPSTCEVARVPLCHSWPPTTTANLWPTYSGQEHLVSAGSDADTLPRSGTCGGPMNWSPPIADSALFRAFKRLSTISWSGTTGVVEEWGTEQDLGYQLDSFSACERCWL